MINFEYIKPSDGMVEGTVHVSVDFESHKYFNEKTTHHLHSRIHSDYIVSC